MEAGPDIGLNEESIMMKHWYEALFAERSRTKVAGLFVNAFEAQDAAIHLLQRSGMRRSQVRVLSPHEGALAHNDLLARHIEPEQDGIWHTIIRAHVTMGAVGLAAGTLLYLLMLAHGSALVHSTMLMAWVAMAGIGGTCGLLVGGLLSIRPDHGVLITLVRRGLEKGQWAVIVHPFNAEQTHKAVDMLQLDHAHIVRSF
jgi:hypothetical protein